MVKKICKGNVYSHNETGLLQSRLCVMRCTRMKILTGSPQTFCPRFYSTFFTSTSTVAVQAFSWGAQRDQPSSQLCQGFLEKPQSKTGYVPTS